MTAKWVTSSSHIDSQQGRGTERVIVIFTLTQNKPANDRRWFYNGEGGGGYSVGEPAYKPDGQVLKMVMFVSAQRKA